MAVTMQKKRLVIICHISSGRSDGQVIGVEMCPWYIYDSYHKCARFKTIVKNITILQVLFLGCSVFAWTVIISNNTRM